MNKLKLVGIKNDQYTFLKNEISKALSLLNGSFQLEEINALDAIVDLELESIPALFVNNKLVVSVDGYLPNADEIVLKLKKATAPLTCLDTMTIPVDFSNISKNAFVFGQNMAIHCDQSIHVVHVAKPHLGIKLGFLDPIGIKKKNMKLFLEQNTIYPNLQISSEIISGNVIKEIINSADKKSTDFILMGTTGRSKKKQLLGSVSRKLSINDAYPSFLIPDNCQFKPFRKIAFAGKHTLDNERLAQRLSSISMFDKAEFFIVEVDMQNDSSYKEVSYTKSNDYSKVVIQDEGIVSGLVAFVENHHIDLLIMYKPSQPFWQNIFHKSNTKKVQKEINIPLLLLH